ncbi:MAG: hypothetical protein Q4D85_07630 [Corynebacterium sp.]|uniref:hypothetical protein n=1 Tax=Corynebacterium sp. TaxID=1720 RepID=UPI0026DAEC76|nr:hypothetical protein [Corynebacterium sp.]MDO5098617.1 hypothetical protein [Corynebacterium sp.]
MGAFNYTALVFFLGFLPALFYIFTFSDQKKLQLKSNHFGGWYFLFEFSLYFISGLFPALLIDAFFFSASMSPIRRLTFSLSAFIIIYLSFTLSTWIRLSGFHYKTRLRDFRPFMREIMGKNPYPDSAVASEVAETNSTWLFKGCATLFFAIPVTIVVLTLVLRHL